MAGGKYRARLREIFGRNHGAHENEGVNDNQTETLQPAGNAAQVAGMQETDGSGQENDIQSAAIARESLGNLYRRLQSSKRGGIHRHSGNSRYYEAVMSAVQNINTAMEQGFSANRKDNLERIGDMEAKYQELFDACAAYVGRGAGTSAGQRRQGIVTEIQNLAIRDMLGLSAAKTDFCSMSEEEQAGKSWNEILDQARTIKLSVTDYGQIGKAEGGQASEVKKMRGENVKVVAADESKSQIADLHFFKPDDQIDLAQRTTAGKIVDNVLERFPKLPKKEQQIIRNWAMTAEKGTEKAPGGLSELGKQALTTLQSKIGGTKVTYNDILTVNGIAEEGGKVNLSKRNVATSRMAALLGLDYMVAKSDAAEVYDEATGQTIRGILMENAGGLNLRDEFTPSFKKAHGKGTSAMITGNAQRDLVNLQVLDVLCGQADRHSGNIMVQTDGGDTITGIKAIDNDSSFGTNIDVTMMKSGERHDRRAYDPNSGEMTLPYMDKNLALRIKALQPDVVRFALKGLITDREVEAAVTRLEMMQKAVDKTMESEPERFLEDNDWNDETAQNMFASYWEGILQSKQLLEDLKEEELKPLADIMAIETNTRNKEQRDLISAAETRARAKATSLNGDQRYSKETYFARIMAETMGHHAAFIKGNVPQLSRKQKK